MKDKIKQLFISIALLILISAIGYAQQKQNKTATDIRATRAYQMLVEERALVETKLNLSININDHTQARVRKFELEALECEMQRLAGMPESNLQKLTENYGALILRRAELVSGRRALLLESTSESINVRLSKVELNLIEHKIILALR